MFIEAHSRLDSTRSFLLGLSHRPVLEGVASFTPMGRLHANFWSLACGRGCPSEDALVSFESGTLRYRTSAVAAVRRLDSECWVAEAEGVFSTAVLLVGGQELVRAVLTQGHDVVACAALKPPSLLRSHGPVRNTDPQPGEVTARRLI